MKLFLSLLSFLTGLVTTGQKSLSRIDIVTTDKDAEKLIQSLNKENYKFFRISTIQKIKTDFNTEGSCKNIADSLGIDKAFYKDDLDNNGKTDLLAIGDYYGFTIVTVLDMGNDSLKIGQLTRRPFQNCVYPKIVSRNGSTLIEYYYHHDSPILKKKELVHLFGDFIEYNKSPVEHQIKKIEYKTGLCFGTCPKFSLTIVANGSAEFNAQKYNVNRALYPYTHESPKVVEGIFRTTIDTASFRLLTELINYIDFPNLDANYAVSWTDDHSCTLKITYDKGNTKEIKDYGLIGTYGLDRLYSVLFDLRFNQDWKPK